MLYPLAVKLSKTGKMPCASYSIPAQSCITGSKLNQIPGSVCHGCYARKNMYVMPSVKAPRDFNLEVWRQFSQTEDGLDAWVNMMIESIKRETKKTKFFRWFDSGDIQSVRMLDAIVRIAYAMPEVRFWLPTHEHGILKAYHHRTIPDNLTVRQSSNMIGAHDAAVRSDVQTSSVNYSGPNSTECTAYTQGGKCLDCRACWDKKVKNINYPLH